MHCLLLHVCLHRLQLPTWLIAIASRLEMMGHTRFSVSSSVRSNPRMRGDDEMAHAPARLRCTQSEIRLLCSTGLAMHRRTLTGHTLQMSYRHVLRSSYVLYRSLDLGVISLSNTAFYCGR